MSGTRFDGFPGDTFAFLAELAKNNDKAWFDENKARYLNHVQTPAGVFAGALAERLVTRFPDLRNMRGKAFRIYRDTRFSMDKTPYKTHIGIRFGERDEKKCSGPVFYVHLEPNRLLLITGVKVMDTATLPLFREAVADSRKGKALEQILSATQGKSMEIRGERSARVPPGFAPDHPRAGLLKAKGLYLEKWSPLPKETGRVTFIEYCLTHFTATKPLYDWFGGL